jgi:multicomponent Na+:H+ antiporter subunit D
MVNLGIIAVGRIVFEVFLPGLGHPVLGLLMVLGLVSAISGAVFALFQDELKRLLAYDTISQMGVLLVGLATGTPGGVAGTAYHLWNHALFKTLLFLCAGAIVHTSGVTKLSEMGGIARRSPWIAAAFCVGVVAISGLPPMNGYGSIGLIHDALREKGQWVPLAGMIVAQTVTIAALGRAAYLAFFQPRDGDYERDEQLRPGMSVALSLLAAGCLGFGVLPGLLVPDVMAPAAGALLHPVLYRTGVLAGGGALHSAMATFDYFSPIDLLTVLGTVLAAIPLAMFVVRTDHLAERARRVLSRVQTGSVNDYASYLVLGVIAIGATLVL